MSFNILWGGSKKLSLIRNMEKDEEHGMWRKSIIWSEKKKHSRIFCFFQFEGEN
jgi:hypothetical protein